MGMPEQAQKGKARQLTPEEMQKELEVLKAKRISATAGISDQDQTVEVAHRKQEAISQEASDIIIRELLSSSDGNITGFLSDGTIKRIGKVSPDGNVEPFDVWAKDRICVREGIIYQLVKIGKVLPNGKIESIKPRNDAVNEREIKPVKLQIASDGTVYEVLNDGTIKRTGQLNPTPGSVGQIYVRLDSGQLQVIGHQLPNDDFEIESEFKTGIQDWINMSTFFHKNYIAELTRVLRKHMEVIENFVGTSKELETERLHFEEAVKWYDKVCEQSCPAAHHQHIRGIMHSQRTSPLRNYETAVKHYFKAAEHCYAPAQFSLGIMYDEGKGVPENKEEAIKWLRKSAAQGYEPAKEMLRKLGE